MPPGKQILADRQTYRRSEYSALWFFRPTTKLISLAEIPPPIPNAWKKKISALRVEVPKIQKYQIPGIRQVQDFAVHYNEHINWFFHNGILERKTLTRFSKFATCTRSGGKPSACLSIQTSCCNTALAAMAATAAVSQ